MMADAMDVGLLMVRAVDHEMAEPGTLHAVLDDFLSKVDQLFAGQRCFVVV